MSTSACSRQPAGSQTPVRPGRRTQLHPPRLPGRPDYDAPASVVACPYRSHRRPRHTAREVLRPQHAAHPQHLRPAVVIVPQIGRHIEVEYCWRDTAKVSRSQFYPFSAAIARNLYFRYQIDEHQPTVILLKANVRNLVATDRALNRIGVQTSNSWRKSWSCIWWQANQTVSA